MNDLVTRPKAVVVASAAIALSYIATLFSWVQQNGAPQYWTSYALLAGFGAVYFGLAAGVYKRIRVARWLLIAWSVLSLISFPIALHTYTTYATLLTACAQVFLWAVALAMLLVKPVRLWFKKA